jgi:hypothetical protein
LGLSPGPAAPKDMDSFLAPFLDELELLQNGVAAYDYQTKAPFLLKAHLVLMGGDTPGITKLLHLKGHNSVFPCRACPIEGTAYEYQYTVEKRGPKKGTTGTNTSYYYPPLFSQPISNCAVDFNSLTRRTSEDYCHDGEQNRNGVKGVSPFSNLATISIPDSCPFDIMHLVFIGFVRDVCAFLSGTYFKDAELNKELGGKMSRDEWVQLGKQMAAIEAPVSWGRYPRNIEKYIKGFKAEELNNFLIHYLLPLTAGRVDADTYRALQRLVFVISLATSYEITQHEIEEIDLHLGRFLQWFYKTYYANKQSRLPACKYTVHGLLHLPQDLRNWGPVPYYWQFPQVLFLVFIS